MDKRNQRKGSEERERLTLKVEREIGICKILSREVC
jgi:hypothetical protein